MQENKLGTMPISKLIFSMSVPLMLSMFIQALYNIVDGIYVAMLSEAALTATTIAFPIQMLMIAFSGGMGIGVNALLSRRLGEKDFDEVNRVAMNSMLLSIVSSTAFLIFGLLFAQSFCMRFTDNPEIASLATTYLSIVTIFSQGLFLAINMERLLQATGRPIFSMIAQIAGAVTNIILDPILIFGRFGAPSLGITGAAIATVIGQFVALALGILFNLKYNADLKLTLRGFRPSLRVVLDIYRIGLPNIVIQSINSFMILTFNRILGGFSDTAVAVLGIYFKLQSFVFMPIFGLTFGMTPMIGYNYGAKKKERILQTIRLGVILACSGMALGTLLFQFFPNYLVQIFSPGDELLAMGLRALAILSLNFIPAGISISFTAVFNGLGLGYIGMINAILRHIVILIPSALLLAATRGIQDIWYAFVLAEIISLVIVLIEYSVIYKKRILTIDQPATV